MRELEHALRHSDTQAPQPMQAIESTLGASSTWIAFTGQIASHAFHLVHFIPSATNAFTGSTNIFPAPRNSITWAAVLLPSTTLSLTSFGPRTTPAANTLTGAWTRFEFRMLLGNEAIIS